MQEFQDSSSPREAGVSDAALEGASIDKPAQKAEKVQPPLDTPLAEKTTNGAGVKVSKLNATVTHVERLNENLVIFRIKPDSPISDFKPGQYVSVGLYAAAQRRDPTIAPDDLEPTKMIERAYSIASSPDQKEYLEFCISILPYGQLTSRIVMVEQGDSIFVRSKITGTFHMEGDRHKPAIPADKNLVFVATGTGIAPFMSMLRTAGTWSEGRKITVVQGVRHAEDLAYRDELLALASEHPNFEYYAAVSREEPGPGIHKGRVTHLFENGTVTVDSENDYVFLCGNPEMIEGPQSLTNMLAARGFAERSKQNPEGHLLFEKYW